FAADLCSPSFSGGTRRGACPDSNHRHLADDPTRSALSLLAAVCSLVSCYLGADPAVCTGTRRLRARLDRFRCHGRRCLLPALARFPLGANYLGLRDFRNAGSESATTSEFWPDGCILLMVGSRSA